MKDIFKASNICCLANSLHPVYLVPVKISAKSRSQEPLSVRAAYQTLKQIIDVRLAANAYSEVDLSKLFHGLFLMK